MKLALLIAALLLGCTDAFRAGVEAYGESRSVRCYSGGVLIYEGTTTGKVWATRSSWRFKDAADGSFVLVSGDCVVAN